MIALLCVNKDNALGYKNDLLYRIRDDLKMFKETTTGGYMVMGRKTHESMGGKALPNRTHIVLSGGMKKEGTPERVLVVNSEKELIQKIHELESLGEPVYLVGGLSLYEKYLKDCTEVLLTVVEDSGVTYDTKIDLTQLDEFNKKEVVKTGYSSGYEYTVYKYSK